MPEHVSLEISNRPFTYAHDLDLLEIADKKNNDLDDNVCRSDEY